MSSLRSSDAAGDAATAWRPTVFDSAAENVVAVSIDPCAAGNWQLPQIQAGAAAARRAQETRRRQHYHSACSFSGDDAAAAEIRRRSFHEGFEEGLRRGREESRETAAGLAEAARALAAARTTFMKDLEANATALALAAARHLAGGAFSGDPRLVHELVARGLHLVKGDAPITIRMNGADLALVREPLEADLAPEAGAIRWIADPGIDRGGFVVETPKRIVDGRIDEALRNLYERLVYE